MKRSEIVRQLGVPIHSLHRMGHRPRTTTVPPSSQRPARLRLSDRPLGRPARRRRSDFPNWHCRLEVTDPDRGRQARCP